MIEKTLHTLSVCGIPQHTAFILANIIILSLLWIVSLLLRYVAKKYCIRAIKRFIHKQHAEWEPIIEKRKILAYITHLIPGIFLRLSIPIFLDLHDALPSIEISIDRLIALYIVSSLSMSLYALINVIHDIFQQKSFAQKYPITAYAQVLRILLFLCSTVVFFCTLVGTSPLAFFAGLGAAMTVVMLIFKDSILGFVASIQLSLYDIIRIGDWITIPEFKADGDVEEISISTVKIRNFDKTVSTVPTSSLLTTSVKNWRGMQEKGGRRIKRSLHIDIKSITFGTNSLCRKLSTIPLLQDYMKDRRDYVPPQKSDVEKNPSLLLDPKNFTNIGAYRHYINAYLKNNDKIHKHGFTFLVRQLQPGATGLPIELYIFTTDTNWVVYEDIQSDIFDHLIAVLPVFELSAFQNVTEFPT